MKRRHSMLFMENRAISKKKLKIFKVLYGEGIGNIQLISTVKMKNYKKRKKSTKGIGKI